MKTNHRSRLVKGVMVSVGIAIGIFGGAVANATVMYEQFTDGDFTSNPTWTETNSGLFSIVNTGVPQGNVAEKAYAAYPNNTAFLSTDIGLQSNVTVSMKFRFQGQNNSNVTLGIGTPGIGAFGLTNTYFVSLSYAGFYGGSADSALFGGGPPALALYATGNTGGAPMDTAWHTIQLERTNTLLRAYFDGATSPFLSATDASFTSFSHVFFGATSDSQLIQFDDITATLAAPEPTAVMLLGLGGLLLWGWRKRVASH